MTNEPDTIFALSSGWPPAAVAVVRISGPRAAAALKALIGKLPLPRRATLAALRGQESGETIDEGLVLWFPGPASATGEDVAELQVHGGRAVIAAVLADLSRLEHCRPAEAGEFTRRAFTNGRFDLTRVEGLADLIAAETEAQRRQAVRHLQGWLGAKAEEWRSRLIGALALVEARIDFVDEGDVPDDLVPQARAAVAGLRGDIASALADERRGERLRDGLIVAIAGPPNAGKSSLLNRIARREAAIVSPYAGTTRDVIEVHLDLGGVPVVLLDTAGIRDSDDPLEQEGVRRAEKRAAEADLVLWVVDAAAGEANAETGSDRRRKSGREAGALWNIKNKSDLVGEIGGGGGESDARSNFTISALTGAGIEDLLRGLETFATEAFGGREPALVTRERHRVALDDVVAALDRALAEPEEGREEIVAEELRIGARALARLVGRVDVEDILDVIFRDFCIGK